MGLLRIHNCHSASADAIPVYLSSIKYVSAVFFLLCSSIFPKTWNHVRVIFHNLSEIILDLENVRLDKSSLKTIWYEAFAQLPVALSSTYSVWSPWGRGRQVTGAPPGSAPWSASCSETGFWLEGA